VVLADLLEGRPGLRISDPRQTSVEVHAHLRELIISGALPPGTVLKQTELAKIFAVSRTPLREAFRMLQEEGLVSAEPNQRSQVIGLDPAELELLYAARVTLESLGVRLTAGRLTREESRDAGAAFREMERTHRAGDLSSWALAHRRFHRLLVGRCGPSVLRTISSYAEQSERYVRLDQSAHRDGFAARQCEHAAILDAVRDGDAQRAVAAMAGHLAGTARRVIENFAPGRGAPSVTAAVEMVTGTAGTWPPIPAALD
jgi:DNA-binding GntR family transcriptional regulator